MGLDQWLYGRKFIWSDKKASIKLSGIKDVNKDNIKYVEFEVGYWRKANQIHRWFVENVQNGEDDCGHYTMTIKQLSVLRNLCINVINYKPNKGIVNDVKTINILNALLPSGRGFFFGSYEYDDWYFENVENTIKIIDKCLKMDDTEFIYTSSW